MQRISVLFISSMFACSIFGGAPDFHVIQRAIAENDAKAVQKFLGKHENIQHCKGPYDQTPLHVACDWNRVALAELLLNAGAGVNAQNVICLMTPLHVASDRGRTEMVRLLLRSGANINAKTRSECHTPLHLAAGKGHEETVKVLLEWGARTDVKNKSGRTAAAEAGRNRKYKIEELIGTWNDNLPDIKEPGID